MALSWLPSSSTREPLKTQSPRACLFHKKRDFCCTLKTLESPNGKGLRAVYTWRSVAFWCTFDAVSDLYHPTLFSVSPPEKVILVIDPAKQASNPCLIKGLRITEK